MNSRHCPMYVIPLALALAATASSCTNNPYRPGETAEATYFSSFSEPPTQLEPATAYYVHEGMIIDQIYEPPFTYHYLKRPYEVIPLTAEAMPVPVYFDKDGNRLESADPPPDAVGRVEYTIRIRSGILYQNHPCFAKDSDGNPAYAGATDDDIARYDSPGDFEKQGTRELTARDYALQIRRLADPRLGCPIYSTLEGYILGMDELQKEFQALLDAERANRKAAAGAAYNQEKDEAENPIALDFFKPDFPGVRLVDDRTFTIALKRKYPQILYWMCMHFFAPVPQEALDFYSRPAMIRRQFVLNRCPVGTGPYFIKVFKPDELMILEKNPNYHEDLYPSEGEPSDSEAGLLADAGKKIPFLDRLYYRMDKEEIPAWNKFMQGYLDASPVYNDVFDQAIRMDLGKDPNVSDAMQERGIRLITDIDTTLWYTAFNMLDDVVGGYSEDRRKLRQAISIALDYNEFIDIFRNGRGLLAQGPIPPGIFGYREGETGTNPFVDQWDSAQGRHVRKPLDVARKLMEEAGFPGGIGSDGKPLVINYDHASGGDTFFRSYFDWMRNRLKLIGITVNERATDLSRFRQKKDQGSWQVASSGWLADYPDPENFLFLFYGPNGKVKHGGPNYFNYESGEFDELFGKIESMNNSPERQELIDKAMRILQRDAPAVWQYYPVSFVICHDWYKNVKPHQMSYNTMKYRRIDTKRRTDRQQAWNRPVYAPVVAVVLVLAVLFLPGVIVAHRRERRS